MAGKIQKLKEDLVTIENQTALMFIEIRQQYHKYLTALSQAVKKQLISASYQICTQVYPQTFLNLSYSQREKLQEKIKLLCQQAAERLLKSIGKADQCVQSPLKIIEQILANLPDYESVKIEQQSLQNSEDIPKKTLVIKHPEQLVSWCKILEKEITNLLAHLSQEVNHVLQNGHILPGQLPAQILDMAIQAEEAGQPISGSPNLLNVLVETGSKNNEEKDDNDENVGKITKIVIVYLRLSEIEFVEPSLSVHHKEIRNLLEKVNQMGKQYHKKQQDCAVAEAEAAWRASWHEE
jgi:hypothetical protein